MDGEELTTLDYAGTIVHAFFNRFMCRCGFCTRRSKSLKSARLGCLGSQHGSLFLNASRAVEEVVEKKFEAAGFYPGIEEVLMEEIQKRIWLSRRSLFVSWGVEYFELDEEGIYLGGRRRGGEVEL